MMNPKTNPPMKIALFGVGALATLYAEKLHPHEDVILLGNNQSQIDGLKKRGFKAWPLASRINFKADLIIFLVKSHQTKHYASFISSYLGRRGEVLTVQNGLGNREIICGFIPETSCHTAVTFQAAFQEGAGKIRKISDGPVFLSSSKISSLFSQARIPVKTTKDIKGVLWRKLILNSAINPLTALFEVKNGELATSPTLASMASQIAQESFNVAQSLKITGMFFKDKQELQTHLFETIHQTKDNLSSMYQDKKRKRVTEIDFINGAIVKQAVLAGIPTPLNSLMLHYVKSAQKPSLHDIQMTPFDLSQHALPFTKKHPLK